MAINNKNDGDFVYKFASLLNHFLFFRSYPRYLLFFAAKHRRRPICGKYCLLKSQLNKSA